MDFLFGKKPDPIEQAKKWKRNIGREVRTIERSIQDIDREEKKLIKDMQKLAREGDSRRSALTILAKNLVRSRAAKEKMHMAKAQLNSVAMNIQMQISTIKVAGCMQKSAEVLHNMNNLIKIPELSQACREMAREMEKAGLIEELIGDAMDSVDTTDEDEVNVEVERVLAEIAVTVTADAPVNVPTRAPAVAEPAAPVEAEQAKAEEDREELELKHMKERLNAL
jgi:charged multivesicular body protein 3